MRTNPTTRICEQCNNTFTPLRNTKGRFCSIPCWRLYEHENRLHVPCGNCGQPFPVVPNVLRKGNGRFCSYACRDKARPLKSLAERFWSKVNKTPQCWFWHGAVDKRGYGRIGLGRQADGIILAHRASWLIHFGDPGDLMVCHKCDNPACVRPDHLFLGDNTANMKDCALKGRTTRGEHSKSAKLNEQQVIDMRRRFANGEVTRQQLADEAGVSPYTVRDILQRVTWRHIG